MVCVNVLFYCFGSSLSPEHIFLEERLRDNQSPCYAASSESLFLFTSKAESVVSFRTWDELKPALNLCCSLDQVHDSAWKPRIPYFPSLEPGWKAQLRLIMPELTLENTDLGADLASHLGRFHGVGLRDNVQLTDTTIICQDGSVRAHQVNFLNV